MATAADASRLRVKSAGSFSNPTVYVKLAGVWVRLDPDTGPPPPSGGFAMPRGPTGSYWGPDADPVSGLPTTPRTTQVAEAADFYDSVGINIKPNYNGAGYQVVDAQGKNVSVQRIAELGVRHARIGLHTPYDHTDAFFHRWTQTYSLLYNTERPAGAQPLFMAHGTNGHPRHNAETWGERNRFTIPHHLRPLDRLSGNLSGFDSPTLGESHNAGTVYNVGWGPVGALQGPNEPDLSPPMYPEGTWGIRDTFRKLKDAKNGRVGETVLWGEDYVSHDTGRIAAGPAKANQIPVLGFAMVFGEGSYNQMGDYTDRADIDFGCFHQYWGGHQPVYEELWGVWGTDTYGKIWTNMTAYNGRLAPNRTTPTPRSGTGSTMWSRTIPCCIGETGYTDSTTGRDVGNNCPPEVIAEYLVRTFILNYNAGIKRTYWYKLNHEGGEAGGGTPPAMGICRTDWTRLPAFYALKNLLGLVGWRQGPDEPHLSFSHSYSAGAPDVKDNPGSSQILDRFQRVALRIGHNDYIHLCTRSQGLWNRKTLTYKVPPDVRNATISLPAGTWSVSVAEPAKNPVKTANDGQTYLNPTDGTAFAAAGTGGTMAVTLSGTTVTVPMCGLSRIVRTTKTA